VKIEPSRANLDIGAVLTDSPLFEAVDSAMIKRLVPLCEVMHCHGAQTLMEEGEETDAVYLLVEGRLRIQVESINPYMEIGLSTLNPGSVVGEMNLVSGEIRCATVLCLDPSVLVKVPREPLLALMKNDPQFGFIVMTNTVTILSKRLKTMNRKMMNIIKGRYF